MLSPVITFIVSASLRGIMGLINKRMEHTTEQAKWRAAEHNRHIQSIDAARKDKSEAAEGLRHILCWAVVGAVFVAPFIISCINAWYKIDIPILYGYTQDGAGGFLWLSDVSKMKFQEMHGYVILPVHTELAAAMGGFLFGRIK